MLLTGLTSLVGSGFLAASATRSGAATTPVSYELDCTTSSQAGAVAPFIVTLNVAPSPSSALPTGASFGASGSFSVELSGGFIAGLAASPVGDLTQGGVGIDVSGVSVASTDGTATGSYSYSHSFAKVATTTQAVANVTWSSGSTTLNGNFTAGAVGQGVTGGSGLPTGATIVAVNAGVSATLNAPTTAAQSAGVSVTLHAPMVFTDSSFSTGSSFTTNGTDGSQASIGLVSASTFAIQVLLSVTFGGASGVGAADCLETGFDGANHPGPVQSGETVPALPAGQVTSLVAASGGFVSQPGTSVMITPPAAASVSLSSGTSSSSTSSSSTSSSSTSTSTASSTSTSTTSPSSTSSSTTSTSSTSTSTTSTSTTSTSTSTTSTTSTTGAPNPKACIPFCFGQPPPPTLGSGGTPPPSAQSGPNITVDPSTDLTDGEPVTITGSGFPPKDSLVAIQCSPLAATSSNASAECDLGAANLSLKSDDSGAFSTVLVVHTGAVGSDPASTCPPATGNCLIAVSEASASSSVRAQADITFAGQAGTVSADALGVSGQTAGGNPNGGSAGVAGGGTGSPGAPTRSVGGGATGAVLASATSGGGGGVLALTGVSRATWEVALLAIGLIDLGYLALSSTWPPRRERRRKGVAA